jgi:polyisoprenoid-binding protein YceI
MKQTLAAVSLFAIAILSVDAAATEYSFDVEGKFVNITFESKMDVEDILGTSHEISGKARFDGKAGSFELKVPVASLRTGIDMRDEHLRSAYWLDSEKFPHISFKGDRIVAKSGGKYEVTGKLTLHGIEKIVSVVVDAKEIPADKASAVGLGDKGALRVRAEFTIKLSDFGVKIPDMAAAKVNDAWTVKISLFAKAQ